MALGSQYGVAAGYLNHSSEYVGSPVWDIRDMIAAARFTGPISLHVEYEPPDEMAAIAHDLEYMKKQV